MAETRGSNASFVVVTLSPVGLSEIWGQDLDFQFFARS